MGFDRAMKNKESSTCGMERVRRSLGRRSRFDIVEREGLQNLQDIPQIVARVEL